MQFNKLLQEAQKMQQQMAEMQNKLADLKVEGMAGAGMVKIVISGENKLISINIDPSLFKEEEKELLEDLIIAAFNEAKTRLDAQTQQEMGKISSAMPPLPAGFKFPF